MLHFRQHLEEGRTNTFTHEGNDYDLYKLNGLIKDNPITQVPISKLIWIFKYDDPNKDQPERIKTADISNPIVLLHWEGQIVVLDGLHRLKKAQQNDMISLPARYASEEDLEKCKLKRDH